MNKFKLFLMSFVLIFGLGIFGFCSADVKDYYYESIKVDIQINQDSTFDVVEEQTYYLNDNFGYFYRDIELKRLDHISNIEVFDGQGRKLDKGEYKVSNEGNYKHIGWDFFRRDFNDELKSWTVKYKVYGGLGFYDDYDEIYWNAIFADREAGAVVKSAEVIVHLPGEFAEENMIQKLFIGRSGSKTESNNYQIVDNKTVRFWGKNIRPGEYLTIVATWPKGFVNKPLFYRNQLINLITLFIALFLPILVFIRSYRIWREKGRDPKIKKTIIAEYSPPDNLAPAVIGVLMKQKIAMKDILATVVDLAVRGYLRIEEKEKKFLFFKSKEYIFEKLKDENDLKPFEQEVIRGIFKTEINKIVSSKDLKNNFYREIPWIKKEIHKEAVKTDLFIEDIQKIRKKYGKVYRLIFIFLIFSVAIAVAILVVFLGQRYLVNFIILIIGLVISAVIGLIFAYFMPALTLKGLEAKWKALGFKKYLHTAERFRIEAETLSTFSKFLPYAMVFGVEKQWAKRFSDFSYQKQGWYTPVAAVGYVAGGAVGPVSMGNFASSFSSFATSMSQTFSSSPGSSGAGGGSGGGGSAGGGGGGGGGGAG